MAGLAFAALVTMAGPAAAHPTLVATMPEAGYSAGESPEEIGLVFDEPVTVGRLAVEGQAQERIATTAVRQARDGKIAVRPVAPLPTGRYVVRWQITAQDGDAVDGAFGFGVGVVSTAVQSEPDTPGMGLAAILRWALFAGLALAFGGLAGDALLRRLVPAGPARRDASPSRDQADRHGVHTAEDAGGHPRPAAIPGCLVGLVAVVGLAAHQTGGGDLPAGLSAMSPAALLGSSAGSLLAVEAGAFATALLAAATPARFLATIPLAVVMIAEGERSHLTAAHGGLGGFTIAVHLAAAALWAGALIQAARIAWRWRNRPAQARAVLLVYAGLAIVVYAVVLATGAVAALWMLPTPSALITTGYGWTLIFKLALVGLVTGLVLTARRRLGRRSASARTGTITRAEAVTLVAVLGASGLLTALPPPADPARGIPYPPPLAGPAIRLGSLTGQVTTAVVAAEGRLEVRLRVPEWEPARDEGYTVRATLTAPGRAPQSLPLAPCGGGCFTGPAHWRPGANGIELRIATDRWTGGTARFTVPWPARPASTRFERARTALATRSSLTFVETVTSDTARPAGFRKRLHMTGRELLDRQPYRSGVISEPVELQRTRAHTLIAFAISAENTHVRMWIGAGDRLLREEMTTPNHQITRTFQPAPR